MKRNLDLGAGRGHEGRQEWLTFQASALEISTWTKSIFLGIILTGFGVEKIWWVAGAENGSPLLDAGSSSTCFV